MQFSADGPDFPPALIDELLAGNAVFVCGAGVSSPQLPRFDGLVRDTFSLLGVDFEPGEQEAFERGRFEEVLGSLARRLVHPSRLYRAVETILARPKRVSLANHQVITRLSRDLDNRLSLVTTNFDTLFENAVARVQGRETARLVSVAGQSLPAPGSEDFSGVIHLHGRLADEKIGLPATPLVLTSAEYGDAYMRSGWASRFLFDLARCKTIVLVGYSASDAPVRYFLNVLESDRSRFSDLRQVYALDAISNNQDDADARWSTVAVQPITYRMTNAGSHGTLWSSLDRLAKLVEKPKPTRKATLQRILSKDFAFASKAEISDLDWLLRGRGDLWDVVLRSVKDPDWFEHFSRETLWTSAEIDWLLPIWFSGGWTDRRRLQAAAHWCAKSSDGNLSRGVRDRLRFETGIPDLWRRAWQLVAEANAQRVTFREHELYPLAMALKSSPPIELQLREGVNAITPHLKLGRPWITSERPRRPMRVRDLLDTRFSVGDLHWATEVANALRGLGRELRLAELASNALSSCVRTAQDADLIVDDWDYLDYATPSISEDRQNDHHDGVVFIVRLLADLLPSVAKHDTDAAINLARSWRSLPGHLGVRMWLHALRSGILFGQEEVIHEVMKLRVSDFWSQRPELHRLLIERLQGARASDVESIVHRIAREGPELYKELRPRKDETDWRPFARDHAMWTRLVAIRTAGALPPQGNAVIEEITRRSPYLDRALEESDLFSAYQGEVRSVTGDPAPLAAAKVEERVEVAHKLMQSFDIDDRAGWIAYCRTDSQAAFEALARVGFRAADVELWRDLISALTFPIPTEPEKQRERQRLLRRIVLILNKQDEDQVRPLARTLSEMFSQARGLFPRTVWAHWWDRLWPLIIEDAEANDEDGDDRFYDRVINSPEGKLAEDLLRVIDDERKARGHPSRANMKRVRRILADQTAAGHRARGALARWVGYLVNVDSQFVERYFLPRLQEENIRGKMLRGVVAEWGQLGPAATKLLKTELLAAAEESRTSNVLAQHVAAKLLLPLVNHRIGGGQLDWGITEPEVRAALKGCSDEIRIGSATCFAIWQDNTEIGPEKIWSSAIRPVFEAVWPQESKFKSQRATAYLARCCGKTGDKFPESVEVFSPYFEKFSEGSADLFFLYQSDLPTKFPAEMLNLLWALLRLRKEPVGGTELAAALDKIKQAAPHLETDRRFQWLEAIALRF